MSTIPDLLKHLGGVPVGQNGYPADVRLVCRSGDYEPFKWYSNSRWDTTKFHTSIGTAYTACTSGRNDTIWLSPDSHSQATALTWAKNMVHLEGMYAHGRMNLRSRIGHSADFTPMLTVSGYGNSFKNLYFMHGRGAAANLNLLTVSGNRNSFMNCHIGGPMNAAEADATGYDLVRITGEENYFYRCFFGVDTQETSKATHIELGAASLRQIFEDCIFVMNADANAPRFIKCDAGLGEQVVLFQNCTFINTGSSSLAYAINGAGLNNAKLYFDSRCNFHGVSYIVAAANEDNVLIGTGGYQAAGTAQLIMTIADHS